LTAYIDLESIGPTIDAAVLRAQMLGLQGQGVQPADRYTLLKAAQAGDTVVCGQRALDYWRLLPPTVALVTIEATGANDPLPRRFDSRLEWALVQYGLDRATARNLVKTPPKTDRHRYWNAYQHAAYKADEIINYDVSEFVAPLLPVGRPEARVDGVREQPYEWRLIQSKEDIDAFERAIREHDGSPAGIDVETDPVGDDANEKRDRLVGIGVAIGRRCFYGHYRDAEWVAALNRCLPALSWIGHSAKFDYAILRSHKIAVGPLAGDSLVAAYLLGLPVRGLKPLVLEYFEHRHITYEEVVGSGRDRRLISTIDPELVAEYCCFTPDMRVLTRDLRWTPLDDIQIGDILIGFTDSQKKMCDAVVTARHDEIRPVVRIELADGTCLTVTSDHPFLTKTGAGRNQPYAWRSLRQGARWLSKFVDPWDFDDGREAGWFAGYLDGEGYLRKAGDQHNGIGWGQKPGAVAERAIAYSESAGYDASIWNQEGLVKWQLRGGWRETVRLLGSVRPTRLLANWSPSAKRMGSAAVEIVSLRVIGRRRVVSIETSCGTYIVEGYGVHNCGDAYWAVELEKLLTAKFDQRMADLYTNVDIPMVTILLDMQEAGVFFDRETAVDLLAEVTEKQNNLASVVDFLARESGYNRPDRVWVCKTCRNGKRKREGCTDCGGQGKFSERTMISLNSPKQLVEWLHEHLQFPVQRLSQQTNQPSVDALALLRMREMHSAIPLVLEWKRLEKHSQFLREWLAKSEEDGRIHPTITNTRVRSHRFSMEDPNLQQVRVPWRNVFIAESGQVLVAGDYGQIEVRVGAYVSQDPVMLQVVRDPKVNIHELNVERLFKVTPDQKHDDPVRYNAYKTRAKNFFFGAMYGSKGDEIHAVIEKQMLEDPALAVLGIPTLNEIRHGIGNIHDIYGRYFKEWVPYAVHMARENGNIAYTLFHRPRRIPNLMSSDKQEREAAERETISHIVQGTATADLMRFALLKVKDILGGTILLTVHDEILTSVQGGEGGLDNPEVLRYAESMAAAMELGQPFGGGDMEDPHSVPIVVTMGRGYNWYATHG